MSEDPDEACELVPGERQDPATLEQGTADVLLGLDSVEDAAPLTITKTVLFNGEPLEGLYVAFIPNLDEEDCVVEDVGPGGLGVTGIVTDDAGEAVFPVDTDDTDAVCIAVFNTQPLTGEPIEPALMVDFVSTEGVLGEIPVVNNVDEVAAYLDVVIDDSAVTDEGLSTLIAAVPLPEGEACTAAYVLATLEDGGAISLEAPLSVLVAPGEYCAVAVQYDIFTGISLWVGAESGTVEAGDPRDDEDIVVVLEPGTIVIPTQPV
jgi:hypothetical protein